MMIEKKLEVNGMLNRLVFDLSQLLVSFVLLLSGFRFVEVFTIFMQSGPSTTRAWEMYDGQWQLVENLVSDDINFFLNSEAGKTIPQIINWPGEDQVREYTIRIYQNKRKQKHIQIAYRPADRPVKAPLQKEPARALHHSVRMVAV